VVWLGRSRKKLSQSEVGRFLGKNYQTIAKMEQGKTCPSVGDCYALADLFGLDDELRDYMIDIARNEAQQNFQTDRRFNALCLQMGELFMGEICKWEPHFLPGIVQTRAYHFKFVKVASNGTDEQANRGWAFKLERIEALLARTDGPKVVVLISEAALHNLRYLNDKDRKEQIDRLRYLDSLPNWEIRIVSTLHPEGATAFDIYRPAGAEFGGPPFAYTEVWDDSWYIEETNRIARYDDLWKILLGKSITLKEHLDDRSDGLAQEHPQRR
jgi:DNA-binding XRE family transcriptional regulator